MDYLFRLVLPSAALAFSACTSGFVSSWKAPDAVPLEVEGSKVAAVLMVEHESSRRMGEDTLAREITERGAQGIPLYRLVPDADLMNEEQVRAALRQAGVEGVVVMRPVGFDKEVVSTPVPVAGPAYTGYWGGYHAYGWGNPWTASDVHTNNIVYVETQVYSLDQNKLVWSGQSKSINPEQVDTLVEQLAEATADELEKQGLIQRRE